MTLLVSPYPCRRVAALRRWWTVLALVLPLAALRSAEGPVLTDEGLRRHVARFNAMEDEPVMNVVPNAASADWLAARVPRWACPDAAVEEIYHFRWWALRKHLRRSDDGRLVFSEFINRADPISSALGHHLMEGRWLADSRPHDEYTLWWLRQPDGCPHARLHRYSQWLAAAVLERAKATGDFAFAVGLLDDLVADYRTWERERRRPDGLFWQYDVRDAMEESISGSRTEPHVRPTINSYMFGNAEAIAALARRAGRTDLALTFEEEARRLRALVQERLWHGGHGFFEVRTADGAWSGVREAIGFIPWYFGLPEPGRGFEQAWAQFSDDEGFRAPFGLTTAERRHPRFRSHGVGTCEWDGAVWPFATSQTLTALGRALRDAPGLPVTRTDYFEAFLTYVRSHRMKDRPYLGEYLDERTGAWLKGDHPRSRWYHHSTFADLVVTGIAGLRPREDDLLEVDPLLPEGTWPWFALDGVPYHGRRVAIVWDRDGSRFGQGAGLRVLVDGREVARAPGLRRLVAPLPPAGDARP